MAVTLGDVELKEDEALVSYAMPYLVQMGRILAETDRRVVHNYIIWRLVREEHLPIQLIFVSKQISF